MSKKQSNLPPPKNAVKPSPPPAPPRKRGVPILEPVIGSINKLNEYLKIVNKRKQ